jgi:hypothetical protein
VQARHGSRKSGLSQTRRAAKRKAEEPANPHPQGDLFT